MAGGRGLNVLGVTMFYGCGSENSCLYYYTYVNHIHDGFGQK